MSATITEKLLLPVSLTTVLAKTVAAAASGVIFGTNYAPTLMEHISNAAGRAFLGGMYIGQIQWLLPLFPETYKSWCAKQKITPIIDTIPSSSGSFSGLWVGDKANAKYVMVYFHGGGWVMPGNAGQLDMLKKFVDRSKGKLAALCVAYHLSPAAPYPIALGQCVEGLRFVLEKTGHAPETVLLGGDSAGGGLVLSVLGHLAHPHPNKDVVKPLNLSGKLFGAMAIDPWISNDIQRYESFTKFANRDTFDLRAVVHWSQAYLGPNKVVPGSVEEPYVWPAHAPSSWWTASPVKAMVASVGEHEVLHDCVVDWAKKYKEAAGQSALDLVVGEKETHIVAILSPKTEEELRKPGNGYQEAALMNWVEKTLV